MKTEIGGDRLGSGAKQNVQMRNFERSTHDLSYLWRSSMSAGTLVPFMTEVGLPGDTFDIDLNCEVMTLPTIGPLFGSYKVQLDVFECPIRLYNGKLHMNMLNIGLDMGKILLPQVTMKADFIAENLDDNMQINPSSIWSYLNIRGLGRSATGVTQEVQRNFNAVPYLAYWDIYKQYYANKQEERGFVIHSNNSENSFPILNAIVYWDGGTYDILLNEETFNINFNQISMEIYIDSTTATGLPNVEDIEILVNGVATNINDLFGTVRVLNQTASPYIAATNFIGQNLSQTWEMTQEFIPSGTAVNEKPMLVEFPLQNIDDMRMDILSAVKQTTPFIVNQATQEPYNLSLKKINGIWTKTKSQEGLGIKTYQSDLFNNWISTEWIDGTNGINAITSVSTANNEFTIDALNLANKVYNMLNRIAISGGTYDDWIDAQYTHERMKSVENPIYHGSLIKELAFEEVISNAGVSDTTSGAENTQPLGTLAGRGRLTPKNKGGKMTIKCNEPCYLMGIVSLTPRIDYSTVNKWDVNLKNMGELHVPSLDAIGYQDLVTDQMAWFDTKIVAQQPVYKSAGKQPAWINYMTNVNQVKGNFAIQSKEMFMTLNRRYEFGANGIEDLTTYVDPSKFNNIFAETNLDSQNFWVQIAINNTARRKMSAKVIPNL